jgi:hypothetical protein
MLCKHLPAVCHGRPRAALGPCKAVQSKVPNTRAFLFVRFFAENTLAIKGIRRYTRANCLTVSRLSW